MALQLSISLRNNISPDILMNTINLNQFNLTQQTT